MEAQQPIDTHDTHLLDALVGRYILLQTGKYPNNRIMARLIDFDYAYLLLETPKAHKQFLLYKGRISEIEPLTEAEAQARLSHVTEAQIND
jgi:hypothetical protein